MQLIDLPFCGSSLPTSFKRMGLDGVEDNSLDTGLETTPISSSSSSVSSRMLHSAFVWLQYCSRWTTDGATTGGFDDSTAAAPADDSGTLTYVAVVDGNRRAAEILPPDG